MKKYFELIIMVFISLMIFTSCSGDSIPSTAVPFDNNFTYPLTVGSQWNYTREFSTFNFRADSGHSDSTFNDTTYYSTVEVKIDREETIIDSLKTYVLSTFEVDDIRTYNSEYYYNNEPDGLFIYAYRSPSGSVVYPKISTNLKYKFNSRYYSSIKEISDYLTEEFKKIALSISDSLMIENPPVQTLKYPMEQNLEWNYRTNTLKIDKKVIGKEIIEVPSGRYECYKIQWLYDFSINGILDENIIFYDFISSKGLMKRTILFLDIRVSSTTHPDGYGIMDVKEEMILTELSVE